MLRRLLVTLSVLGALVFGGCSQPVDDTAQAITKTELIGRGFTNPTYSDQHSGWSLYNVDFGTCRLVVGTKDGSFAWLVEPGDNSYWDYWVTGDDRLNADWLRTNATGMAYTDTYAVKAYDLQPCLTKTSN